MDDIQGSLSKMKKKIKHRLGLRGRKRKSDGTGANPGGEGADSTSSLPQSEPHVVVDESYDGEGDKADAAGEPIFSTDRPQPEKSELASTRGSENDQEGEISQRHPHLHSDSKIEAGSGPGGKAEWVTVSGSTPLLSLHGGELGGTRTWLFSSLPLIFLLTT